MPTLESIRKKITTAEELQSVVKVMKGLAAASIRQFERAVTSLADYSRSIELGLQTLLSSEPERLSPADDAKKKPSRLGAVVFGSDQGMCGRFNQLIAEHATDEIRKHDLAENGLSILIVGGRIVPLLEMEGFNIDRQVSPATSLGGITPLVHEVLGVIQTWREEQDFDRIVLCYNEARGGTVYGPHTHQLFPLDLDWLRELQSRPWPTNRLPIHTVAWEQLFAAFIREHIYIALFRAAAESLASENASRLASMQAAERNIEERLEALGVRYRHTRQESITEELLDIISGFEALSTD